MATERDISPETLMKALVNCRVAEIIDPEKRDEFHTFLHNRGIPVRGYVITMPLSDGRLWAEYRIKKIKEQRLRARYQLELTPPRFHIDKDPDNRSAPESIQSLPVWWLDEQMEK